MQTRAYIYIPIHSPYLFSLLPSLLHFYIYPLYLSIYIYLIIIYNNNISILQAAKIYLRPDSKNVNRLHFIYPFTFMGLMRCRSVNEMQGHLHSWLACSPPIFLVDKAGNLRMVGGVGH
jgi:hypothetical protein